MSESDTFNILCKWTYEDAYLELLTSAGRFRVGGDASFKIKTGWNLSELKQEFFRRYYNN